MTPIFADTFYYLAIVNSDDERHAQAVELSRLLIAPIITHRWVLAEVGDAMFAPVQRPNFIRLYETIHDDPGTTIVPSGPDLFERGVELFGKRLDKEWSLTDCISFVVMLDHGITEALTADHHFEQADSKHF